MKSTLNNDVKIAVIGAGLAGVATAYYLSRKYQHTSIALIDQRVPLSYTTAQSGNNYRNWWAHPSMKAFIDHSIDLMENIINLADANGHSKIDITRGGYALATRADNIDELLHELQSGDVRLHQHNLAVTYGQSLSDDWRAAPDGVDVLSNPQLIREYFPAFNSDPENGIKHVIHIRRAGDFDSQALGQHMLAYAKSHGTKLVNAEVTSIETPDSGPRFKITMDDGQQRITQFADIVVNAAGPYVQHIAAMLGSELDIHNVFQQKILFADTHNAVPRNQPFSIDLDPQTLDWTAEERELLMQDPDMARFCETMQGGVHCRPEGGAQANWVKLGWAYNQRASSPKDELINDENFDSSFPEIVLRAASSLNPSLKGYQEDMPKRMQHYGGYYSMTDENWPLIGPLENKNAIIDGAYVVGALSGFGSMAACAAGELVADWINHGDLPDYAHNLSLQRYQQPKVMQELAAMRSKGIL